MTASNNQEIKQITDELFAKKTTINPSLLTSKLRKIANSLIALTGVAKEHAVHDVLAFSTLVASQRYRVKLCYGGVKPVSNYYFLVAETGGMKSTIHEKLLYNYLQENGDKYIAYRKEIKKWKKEVSSLESSAKKQGKSLTDVAMPEEPINPNAYTNNCTFEGLLKELVLKDLSIVSDDGGRVYKSIGTNRENINKFIFGLNDLWGSNIVDNLRSSQEYNTYVPAGKVVNIVISTQAHIFNSYIATKDSELTGFGGRVLVTVPKEAEDAYHFTEEQRKVVEKEVKEFSELLSNNLYSPKPLKDRVIVSFPKEFNALLVDLGKALRREVTEGGRAEHYRAFTLKFVEHIHRIAVAVMWLEGEATVTEEIFKCVLELGRYYYASHCKYMHEEDRGAADKEKKYKKIKKWLKVKRENHVVYISGKDIRDNVGRAMSKEMLQEILQDLQEEEFITSMFGTSITIDGKRCKTAYRINPESIESKIVDFGDLRADPADPWVSY